MITFQQLLEKTLTPAEKKKREEIAKAMEKDNPDMPMGKKMAIATATAKRVAESDFEPHMMYDPKTGKSEKAEKPEDHERLKKKGYTHEKPEVKEAKSSSGYELYHRDFSGAMQHAYAHAKKKGFIVDKDDIDSKVAMGPKRPSSGKTNKYILDTNKKQKLHIQVANLDNKRYELNMYIESVQLEEGAENYTVKKGPYTRKVDGKTADKMKRQGWKIVAREGLEEIKENYRTLARGGMGTESKGEARVGLELDYYDGAGTKRMGKITKVTAKGYIVKDEKDGKNRQFTFHDRAKAKEILARIGKGKYKESVKESRAYRDAMRAMGKRGKDPADVDITATDDDRKAASKNVLMQIRKATDLPKGSEIEFPSGKKGKISQDDAKKVDRLFNMLKRPADKEKFQKIISKDLNSIKGLLKRLGR